MTEMVIAAFEATSAADAAVQDLEVARIPSAVIRREVSGDQERRDDSAASDPGAAGEAVVGPR